jgi:hypothetical protein
MGRIDMAHERRFALDRYLPAARNIEMAKPSHVQSDYAILSITHFLFMPPQDSCTGPFAPRREPVHIIKSGTMQSMPCTTDA